MIPKNKKAEVTAGAEKLAALTNGQINLLDDITFFVRGSIEDRRYQIAFTIDDDFIDFDVVIQVENKLGYLSIDYGIDYENDEADDPDFDLATSVLKDGLSITDFPKKLAKQLETVKQLPDEFVTELASIMNHYGIDSIEVDSFIVELEFSSEIDDFELPDDFIELLKRMNKLLTMFEV